MKKDRMFWVLLLCMAGFLFGGCEVLQEALEEGEESDNPNSELYRPRFRVGVFNIVRYPRALELEKEITTGDGRSVWINKNQGFSSKNLRDARWMPRPGNPDLCDLQFRLSRTGKTQWQMLTNGRRGEEVALMIDDRYVGNFIPEIPDNQAELEWVTVRIGLDNYTARGVAKYARKNYAHYNPETKNWFIF